MHLDQLALRPATPADTDAVHRLVAATFPRLLKADYPPSVMVTAVPLIARANPRLIASGRFWLAEQDGEVVGVGGWSPLGSSGSAAEVRQLVVDWRHARQGIGRRLMDRLRAETAAVGARRLEVLATRTAVPFYRSMGFIGRTEVAVSLAPGIVFPAVGMRLRF